MAIREQNSVRVRERCAYAEAHDEFVVPAK